ncbi:MAG: histidine phosphatase family protein [Patescibacteria group bacterium]|jgi:broad specificity phosphatase PhoE
MERLSWIYFLRHGESEANSNDNFFGHPKKIKLTDKGHEQAREIFQLLKKEKFDLIITSPFLRAWQTAKPFIDFHGKKIPVKVWSVGEFTYHALEKYLKIKNSRRWKLAHKYWERSDPDYRDGSGAETYREFMGRIDRTRKKLEKSNFDKILIVTHGYFIKHFIWRLLHQTKKIDHKTMTDAMRFSISTDAQNTALVRVAKIDGKLYVGEIDARHVRD